MCVSECVAEDAREGSAERGNDWSFLPFTNCERKGDVPRAGYPTFNLISGLHRRVDSDGKVHSRAPYGPLSPFSSLSPSPPPSAMRAGKNKLNGYERQTFAREFISGAVLILSHPEFGHPAPARREHGNEKNYVDLFLFLFYSESWFELNIMISSDRLISRNLQR